jgi:hypothetical protein
LKEEVKLDYFIKIKISLTSNFNLLIKNFMALILATKLEMTRVIKDSKVIPVTLLQVPELKII